MNRRTTDRSAFILWLVVLGPALPAWPSASWAAEAWYVAPDGSDSAGDGSRVKPWKTLRCATDRVPDEGGTIVLVKGLYEGAQSVSRPFRQACTVRAERPYRARLCSAADRNRVLTCYGATNVKFQGLEMYGSGGTRDTYLVHVGNADIGCYQTTPP